MRGVRRALQLGSRRVLALTCWSCGLFKQASEFGYRDCRGGRYLDRRRRPCRWLHAEASLGRNSRYN